MVDNTVLSSVATNRRRQANNKKKTTILLDLSGRTAITLNNTILFFKINYLSSYKKKMSNKIDFNLY